MILPSVSATKFVYADLARHVPFVRKIGHDQRDVSAFRDHRVFLVYVALTVAAGMGVNIRYDLEIFGPAQIPHEIHPRSIEHNRPAQTIWIDLIVRNEALDQAAVAVASAQ
jgi:hypothetical protein